MEAARQEMSATPDHYVAAPPVTWLDDDWDVRLRVHREAVVDPGLPEVPTPLLPQDIMRVSRDETTIVVRGYVISREVDMADWLTYAPTVEDKEIVRSVPVDKPGVEHHLELRWIEGQDRLRGNYFARRSGTRVFLLTLRAPEQHIAPAREDFSVAVASLTPQIAPLTPYAEPMRSVRNQLPIAWSALVPEAWIIEPGSAHEQAASLSADHLLQEGPPPFSTVGKLSCAVLSLDSAKTARDVLELYLGALRDGGLDVGGNTIEHDDAWRPFDKAWHMLATVRRGTMIGELRVRIMRNKKVWALTAVMGVQRGDNLLAWMQNKRALDVVSRSMRFS